MACQYATVSAIRNNMAIHSRTVELELGRPLFSGDRSLGMVHRNETRSVILFHIDRPHEPWQSREQIQWFTSIGQVPLDSFS